MTSCSLQTSPHVLYRLGYKIKFMLQINPTKQTRVYCYINIESRRRYINELNKF